MLEPPEAKKATELVPEIMAPAASETFCPKKANPPADADIVVLVPTVRVSPNMVVAPADPGLNAWEVLIASVCPEPPACRIIAAAPPPVTVIPCGVPASVALASKLPSVIVPPLAEEVIVPLVINVPPSTFIVILSVEDRMTLAAIV